MLALMAEHNSPHSDEARKIIILLESYQEHAQHIVKLIARENDSKSREILMDGYKKVLINQDAVMQHVVNGFFKYADIYLK